MFLNRAKKKHGDEYDYSESIYIDGKTKVCIICKKHGRFYTLPGNHLSGSKCRKCSYEKRGLDKRYKIEDLIHMAKKVHGNKYLYNKFIYTGIMEHGIISCKIHGDFLQTFNDHIHNKAGCPKCARENKKIKKSVLEFPNVMKEWDYEKNKISPEKVSYGSQRKVWWFCEQHGHSWQAMARNRTIYNTGCPKCNAMVLKENCLTTTHPHLLSEWDYSKNEITPDEVTHGSDQKVWWVCKNDHEWDASVKRRAIYKFGCPYCSGKRVCKDNCIATMRPDLVEEWSDKNLFGPEKITCGSGKKVWWVCENGHEWETSACERKNHGCPYCSGNKVCEDNCLATKRPDLVEEWSDKNNISPKEVSYGSKKRVWWVCSNGHEWISSINNRTNNYECPHCSKRISKSGTKWLDKHNVPIREYYININNKRIYVDGFDDKTNTVFEYFGSFWHGNKKIYDQDDINPITKTSYGCLYQKTIEKINLIEAAGYNLVYKWGE